MPINTLFPTESCCLTTADCIKFQTFRSENLVSYAAPKAEYQKATAGDGSQLDMLKKLELSYDEFLELKSYCDSCCLTTAPAPTCVSSPTIT